MITDKSLNTIKAVLFTCFLFIPSAEVRAYELNTIDWTQFTEVDMSDSLSEKIKILYNHSLRYTLDSVVDTLTQLGDSLYDINVEHCPWLEGCIRPHTQSVMATGIGIALDIIDPAFVGRSVEEVTTIHTKLVRSLVLEHKANDKDDDDSNDNQFWGYCWQCSHWSFFLAWGAWMTSDLFDQETWELMGEMVATDAKRYHRNPYYCNDCTHNTYAEEEAWNANIFSIALAMMPDHEDASIWREKISQYNIAAYSRESDLSRDTIVDGKAVKDWISGWNMREEGFVYNHNRLHPDYTAAILINLWNVPVFFLAGQKIPQAIFWNSDVVYDHLVDYEYVASDTGYAEPGGTIYRHDEDSIYALCYYPEGTDRANYNITNHHKLDIQVHTLGLDHLASVPAIEFARKRTDFSLWMQSRTPTGQIFIPEDRHSYPCRESKSTAYFAIEYLQLYLSKQAHWNSPESGHPFPVAVKKRPKKKSLPFKVSYSEGFSGMEIALRNYPGTTGLSITDTQGKQVRSIPVTSAIVTWDFTDDYGADLASGIYIMRAMGSDKKAYGSHFIKVFR